MIKHVVLYLFQIMVKFDKNFIFFIFVFLDTTLLSLLAYNTSTLECAFEIVLVLSTLASLSDIARVNELYPSVVTKVIQPKKYAARHYDLVIIQFKKKEKEIKFSCFCFFLSGSKS